MSLSDRVYDAPSYRRMIRQKTVAVVSMTVFFIAYYFALPVLVGYWPAFMARKAWGHANLAYLFAFSQFLMTWGIAYAYMRYASRFDRVTASILSEMAEAPEAVAATGGK